MNDFEIRKMTHAETFQKLYENQCETCPGKNGKRRFMYVVVRIDAFLYARVRINNK